MDHLQNQYGAVPQTRGYDDPDRQTDEFGNPIRRTDRYGNPVHYTDTTAAPPGGYASGGYGSTTATGVLGHGDAPAAGTGKDTGGYHEEGHRGLHRSGSSSSSSSSEDDGQGGRRKKKGLKEKIKEKLPGVGHKDQRSHASVTTTAGGYGATGEGQYYEQHHEKKGIMDTIKDKFPGHHH